MSESGARCRDSSIDARVLIVVHNLPVPFDRRVWLEATTLTQAGCTVSVISPKGKGHDAAHEELEGVDIHRYGLPTDASGPAGFVAEFLWCFVRTVMKAIRVGVRGRGFDVLHVCNPPEIYWPLGYVCKLLGKGFLFDHHDLSPELYEAKFERPSRRVVRALRLLERLTFRAADVVVTTNESYRQIAIERGGVDEQHVYVVRSGPSLARFRVVEPDPAVRPTPYLLVYLGEICKQDGVEGLLRVLKLLRDDFGRDDVHCLLIGGGPHQPAVVNYADELGIPELCTFTGDVRDDLALCRLLSSADIGVVPDPRNPYSDNCTMNKVMEYMFFGLPVVGFDLKENRMSAGSAALWAPPNEVMDLAKVIDALLDDPERRAEMGRVGQERLREGLEWEHSVAPLLAAYADATARM